MENKEIAIRKIPLNTFIDILVELYNRGVDFVDLSGETGNKSDRLAISFTEDYMAEEAKENFKDVPYEDEIITTKLSEEDLDQLI